MPRDAGGNWIPVPGNPVVTGTVITSTWANPTMSDFGAEISNSLSRDGQGGMRVPLNFFDGTKNDPGITFTLEPTAGVYRDSNGVVGISAQGKAIALFKGPTGNVETFAAAPIEDNDLSQKAWVEAAIAAALVTANADIAAALAAQAELDWPVGSRFIGPDPTGAKPGTWSQAAEGTFLMNTVAGADLSGGSNDAVVVNHDHPINHDHPSVTSGGGGAHDHNVWRYDGAGDWDDSGARWCFGRGSSGANFDERWSGLGASDSNDSDLISGTGPLNPAPNHVHPVDLPSFSGTSGAASGGVDGTDLNKPLYVGVEVWERVA
jgi:hypothetical protein